MEWQLTAVELEKTSVKLFFLDSSVMADNYLTLLILP